MTTAMILCAGFGKRLNELTKDTPKPMLPVEGKPLLEYIIAHLCRLNIKKIIINIHYLAEKITSYFGNGRKWNVEITYSCEDTPLGTSGAVKKVEKILSAEDNFLVLHGDVVCGQDYNELVKFQASRKNAAGTIILHRRTGSNSIVELDDANRIIKFQERPKNPAEEETWVNSSIYCFNKEIFNYIPAGTSDFPEDIFPGVIKDGKLYGYPLSAYRCSVDSRDRYEKLKNDIKNGRINN